MDQYELADAIEETRIALIGLQESVAHWRRLETYVREGGPEVRRKIFDEGWRSAECSLCALYIKDNKDYCIDCPLFKETTMRLCDFGVYRQAATALSNEYHNEKAKIKNAIPVQNMRCLLETILADYSIAYERLRNT